MHASGICRNPNSVGIADKRTLIQGVLIHGMCLFEVRLTARFPRSLRSLGMTRVGHPHPIVMLSEVETSPGKEMM